MNAFEAIDNKYFATLSDIEMVSINGGSCPSETLVSVVFDIGKEAGRVLRKLFP